ncbi:MAG: tetratricopeptide repeat protein [Candidatus Zixiibacteriota bacterium]
MNRLIATVFCIALATFSCSCSKGGAGKASGATGGVLDLVDHYEFNAADSLLAAQAAKDSLSFATTYTQGISYERQFQFYDALLSFMNTIVRHPDSTSGFVALNRVFTYLGSAEEAAEAARRWSELEKGNGEARMRYIRALIDAGAYEKAEQQLEEARKVGLDQSIANLLQARLQVISYLFTDASKSASDAIAQNPGTPEYFLALADYYEECGQIDSSINAGAQSYAKGQNQYYGFLQFQRALRHKYLSTARAYLDEISAADKSKIASSALLVMYMAATDSRSGLQDIADVVANSRPNLYSPFFLGALVGRCMWNNVMIKNNLDRIEGMVAAPGVPKPFVDFITWERSKYYRWPADPRSVAFELAKVRGWREALPRYAAFSIGASVLDTSRKVLYDKVDSICAANKERPRWLAQVGWTYTESLGPGIESARRTFNAVLARDPMNASAFVGMVQNEIATKQFPEVRYAPTELVERFPEAGLWRGLEDLYYKNSTDALTHFKKSFPLAHETALAEEYLALLQSMGKTAEAQEIVKVCVEAAPNDPDAQLLASDHELQQGNVQSALDHAEAGLVKEPGNSRLKACKAQALYALGKKDDAIKLLQELLAKDQGDPDASLVYSRILVESGGDTMKAQNLARQAVANGKLSQRPMVNLAYVYLKTGRPDLASGAAMRAVELYPNDPEAYYYYGWSQIEAGKPGGRENIQKSISLGLTGEQLQAARELLVKK